jgi:hypothetical protein
MQYETSLPIGIIPVSVKIFAKLQRAIISQEEREQRNKLTDVAKFVNFSSYVTRVRRRQNSKGTNVPQTFHKRSTNVPRSNRNETKTFEFVSEFVSKEIKEIISIWSTRADSGPNRKNLFSRRQIQERYKNVLISFQKRYWNV